MVSSSAAGSLCRLPRLLTISSALMLSLATPQALQAQEAPPTSAPLATSQAAANQQEADGSQVQVQVQDAAMADRMLACTACHGPEGRAGADGYYPRIAGKPAGYLYQQLLNFRDGRRIYDPMTVLLQQLPDQYLYEIGQFFAQQHPPYPPPERTPTTPAQMQRGEELVRQGDANRGLPACVACHGATLAGFEPGIPGLLGLSRDYLTAQLGAWQNGTRRSPEPDCMAELMQRLPPSDLAAVAAWLSHQPVPVDYRPSSEAPSEMPLTCHTISLPGVQP